MIQLGIVTYNIAKDWDLATILKNLETLGIGGVELRTGHAHGVEISLNAEQRREVRKRFEDSPVELAGLGSTYEFQSIEPGVLKKNIDGAKEYTRLAHDVGSPGIKVRPNGLPKGADLDETLKRIGAGLHQVGEDAQAFGVEVRVEIHGNITQDLPNFAKILEYADHPNVFACWNSNPGDVNKDGTILDGYKPIGPKIREVHLRDLTDDKYPWRELFSLLKNQGYEGYTLAEIQESADPLRVLGYFKALWMAYQP